MMTIRSDLFTGRLIHLVAENPEVVGKTVSRWERDAEYMRLMDSDPPMLVSAQKIQAWIEKDLEKGSSDDFFFLIRTLDEERLIGFVALFNFNWIQGTAWLGIGLGEKDCWGKGYGTDAIRVALRYAFDELNLHRVSLDLFSYNQRALRAYEKTGFRLEGRIRGALLRQGRRWDAIKMGILHHEWAQLDGDENIEELSQ